MTKVKTMFIMKQKYLTYLSKVLFTKKDFSSWKKFKKSSNVLNKFWVPYHYNQVLTGNFENHTSLNYQMLCKDFVQWKIATWKLTRMEILDPGNLLISNCCC